MQLRTKSGFSTIGLKEPDQKHIPGRLIMNENIDG